MDNDIEQNDIEYEEDQGAALVKKLRAKLKKCEQEKKEYLDGWQRLKADTLNTKRQQATLEGARKQKAIEDVLFELLPALDSFDIALSGTQWDAVDETWRKGIEHVHGQLVRGLSEVGISRFGAPGDVFDPLLYEAVGYEAGSGQAGTVVSVKRLGYKFQNTVLRAAQVTLIQEEQ